MRRDPERSREGSSKLRRPRPGDHRRSEHRLRLEGVRRNTPSGARPRSRRPHCANPGQGRPMPPPPYGRGMEQLIALVGFSVVSSVTPGPKQRPVVGVRRPVRVQADASARRRDGARDRGDGPRRRGRLGLITAVPEVAVAMKAGGSLTSSTLPTRSPVRSVERGSIARPSACAKPPPYG